MHPPGKGDLLHCFQVPSKARCKLGRQVSWETISGTTSIPNWRFLKRQFQTIIADAHFCTKMKDSSHPNQCPLNPIGILEQCPLQPRPETFCNDSFCSHITMSRMALRPYPQEISGRPGCQPLGGRVVHFEKVKKNKIKSGSLQGKK